LTGTIKRIEEHFGKKMAWLGCTHHILELIIGKLFKSVFGETKSPEDTFCSKFKSWWNGASTEAPYAVKKLKPSRKKIVKEMREDAKETLKEHLEMKQPRNSTVFGNQPRVYC
jgi:hypothetical protein